MKTFRSFLCIFFKAGSLGHVVRLCKEQRDCGEVYLSLWMHLLFSLRWGSLTEAAWRLHFRLPAVAAGRISIFFLLRDWGVILDLGITTKTNTCNFYGSGLKLPSTAFSCVLSPLNQTVVLVLLHMSRKCFNELWNMYKNITLIKKRCEHFVSRLFLNHPKSWICNYHVPIKIYKTEGSWIYIFDLLQNTNISHLLTY